MSIHRICILTSGHKSSDTRVFHKQAITLMKAGYDVTLVAQNDRKEEINGIKIVPLVKPRSRLNRMFVLPLRILKAALKQKAQVYHLHDPELFLVGVLLKILTNSAVIYDIHEDYRNSAYAKDWIPSFLRNSVSIFYTYMERLGLILFDGIITAGEDILAHFPKSPKLFLVRNYPLLDKAKLVIRKSNPSAQLTLIYLGAMTRERGVKEIVKAVNSLGDKVRLILLGSFPVVQFGDEIKKMAGDNISFVDHVPYDEIFGLMGQSDVGLVCFLPSPNNIAAASRNNKLFEYMSAGLSVISSNFPAWKEVVEGNNCGITVDITNHQEAKSAIEYLSDNPKLVKIMGKNGQEAVAEKYNWERESETLLCLYDRLLRPNKNAR